MYVRSVAVLATLALMLVSCGGQGNDARAPGDLGQPSSFATPFTDEKVYPTFVSSELAVGANRFLVGLLNDKDAPIGSPEVDMRIYFYDLQRSTTEPVSNTRMRWTWVTRPYLGLYRGRASFDHPGQWGAEVRVEGHGLDETVRTSFNVKPETSTPAIGERVPASDTPTADEVRNLKEISTDTNPVPRFYEKSIAEAIEAGEPFVVTFSTPKFCTSQVCGPMLDNVKRAARDRPDLTFIHVEPYELPADPADLRPVRAALQWGLPSEPWTFVVDGRGRLAASFEGALTPGELKATLKRLP